MINAKRIFIIVFTCLLSLSINNVYAQNHGSLTIHCHYLDVHNHIFNISQDHIALINLLQLKKICQLLNKMELLLN